MRTEINFLVQKNGDHRPSSLGGRSIAAARHAGSQTDKMLAVYKIFKILQFQF